MNLKNKVINGKPFCYLFNHICNAKNIVSGLQKVNW